MQKPTMKCEVKITDAMPNGRAIYLYATPDAAEDFSAFGLIQPWAAPNQYRLEVDPRFDFGEVVKYINAYSSDTAQVE